MPRDLLVSSDIQIFHDKHISLITWNGLTGLYFPYFKTVDAYLFF